MVSDYTTAVVGLVRGIGIDGESVDIGGGIGKEEDILQSAYKRDEKKICGYNDERRRSFDDGSIHDRQDYR